MLDKELYYEKYIENWDELNKCFKCLLNQSPEKKWRFKGKKAHSDFKEKHAEQQNQSQEENSDSSSIIDLLSSLERIADKFNISFEELPECEDQLLREFKRRIHHYTTNVPKPNNTLEWLALMQHHGAPTRLVDFTYSFYVAAFFALEGYSEKGYEIWAINTAYFDANRAFPDIKAYAKKKNQRLYNTLQTEDKDKAQLSCEMEYLRWREKKDNPITCVHPANPYKLNERLTIQQGTFLFPGNLTKSFEDNLSAEIYRAESKDNLIRFQLNSNGNERENFLKLLHFMNINRATLFPGLDGFAQSLSTRLPFLPRMNEQSKS